MRAHQGGEEWRAGDGQHIVPACEWCAGFTLQRSSGLPIIPFSAKRTLFLHGVLKAIAVLGVVAFDVK